MKTRNWLGVTALGFLLTLGLFQESIAQHRHRHHKGDSGGGRYEWRKQNFSSKIYRITQADSTQKAKMKPILASAEKRFEALRKNYTEREKKLMDSVQVQLKPVLREEQLKKLEEFKGYRRKKHFRN